MAEQILDALNYLHGCSPEPIIYRDLKPSNLMLLADDTIKMIDFGTARLFKQENSDDTIYLGTPGYAAPEQYGAAQTDIRTDIFNFGMTLFHLVTGKHPLQCAESQREQILGLAGVSQQFASVILRCVSVNPGERYGDIAEIRKALRAEAQRFEPAPAAMGKNAVEISVSGIQSGIGVTHFCLLFGIWLKNQGFRTAVLEYGENRDAMALCKLVEKETHVQRSGFFQVHGLSIYPSMRKEEIDGFKRSEYEYILVDYGVHSDYVSVMSQRSDVRLIFAPGADWKLGLLGDFLRSHNTLVKSMNTYLCFPFQNLKSIRIIQTYYHLSNMLTIPYAINPWKLGQEESHALELIYEKLFRADSKMNYTGKRRTS